MGAVTEGGFGRLYNSPLETGIRAVVVLEHVRPARVDLSMAVLLDHAVVHTGDLGGPASLHPNLPGRSGEILVRRRLVEAGLDLMRRCHLVEVEHAAEGVLYGASDEAAAYVELLETAYSVSLRNRACWVSDLYRERSEPGFKAYLRERIGDWGGAFDVASQL